MLLVYSRNHQEAKDLLLKGTVNFQKDFYAQILLAKIETGLTNHAAAERYFNNAYAICPNSIQGFAYYSSCLW